MILYLLSELIINLYKKSILLHYIFMSYIYNVQNNGLFIKNVLNLIAHNTIWDYVSSDFVYLFFFFIIFFSSLGVILSKNPIHSIFFLILVFLNVGFFLLMLHVEFLAFLIFIVYLGAIAVLFLFVIMMFNIHILESRDNIIRYLPLVFLIFIVILEMTYITDIIDFRFERSHFTEIFYSSKSWYDLIFSKENMVVLTIIYNFYVYNFIIASLILLTAMVGAIVLTLNILVKVKKQEYYRQNSKNLYNTLVLKTKGKRSVDLFEFQKKSFLIPKRKPWWEYF